MSEENKRKINLSGLQLGNKTTSKTEDTNNVLDVAENNEEAKEAAKLLDLSKNSDEQNGPTEEIVETKKPSNKISLAGMKEKRIDNSKVDEKALEDTSKDTASESETANESTQVEKKSISLDEEKVEVVLEAEDIQNNEKNKNESLETQTEENKEDLENGGEGTEVDQINTGEEANTSEKNTSNTDEGKSSLFSNYTSDFEKDEGSIIDKLKELGKKPQTRIMLVVGMIVLTILGIAALFLIDPKRHSISHYKAVLTGFYNKHMGDPVYIKQENKPEVDQAATLPWKDESLVRNGYQIAIKTQVNASGVKIYKFNNSDFDTIAKLNKEIDIEIEKLKTNKVKDFLLNPIDSKENNNTPNPQDEKTPEKTQKKSPLQLLQERK